MEPKTKNLMPKKLADPSDVSAGRLLVSHTAGLFEPSVQSRGDFEIGENDGQVELTIQFAAEEGTTMVSGRYQKTLTLHMDGQRARDIAYQLLQFANYVE